MYINKKALKSGLYKYITGFIYNSNNKYRDKNSKREIEIQLSFSVTLFSNDQTRDYNVWNRILQANRSIPQDTAHYCNDMAI